MYVGYHDTNNVSPFGGDPVSQLNLQNVFSIIYAVLRRSIAAAVATQPRADCSSMEGHTNLCTAVVSSAPVTRAYDQVLSGAIL